MGAAALLVAVVLSSPSRAEIPLTDAQLDRVTAGNFVVAPLSDGRLELWYTQGGQLLSSWQTVKGDNSTWTGVSGTNLPSNVSTTEVEVTRLPDGRLQLFAVGPQGTFTTQKITTDSNSAWTTWTPLIVR